MNIRIYNVVTRDGYLLDKKGEHFLYFTADKKQFLQLYKTSDCLILDYEHYEYLEKVGVLSKSNKFIVVIASGSVPQQKENIWFTNLPVKQIKREIKIQGYHEVLCLLNTSSIDLMLSQKVATEMQLTVYHTIEGGGVEKIEFDAPLQKKVTPVKTAGKDYERFNYILKK